jgi:hypothetical protein
MLLGENYVESRKRKKLKIYNKEGKTNVSGKTEYKREKKKCIKGKNKAKRDKRRIYFSIFRGRKISHLGGRGDSMVLDCFLYGPLPNVALIFF